MSISRFREITLRAARTFTKGYSEVQSKVREATSNDPWVSEKQLKEIAKLTNNPDFFQEIVGVLEKRLNDIGKNWRHVLKVRHSFVSSGILLPLILFCRLLLF
ncbi:hypothetical protein BD410DRAFT_719631 [Rickenella mellea]|uniref:ENTH domain-containing protein n=1 Tax=Rickenella mellea TaxID=50990 RepID=A0A4Y7Q9X4_9AGAM|nr:hypothetical protein BD410DRAFT_719631 [Rickenella mellea]